MTSPNTAQYWRHQKQYILNVSSQLLDQLVDEYEILELRIVELEAENKIQKEDLHFWATSG